VFNGCFGIRFWSNRSVQRNGAKLCGDTTLQGIAGPMVSQWTPESVSVFY
jgi:hypothetical protein